jgi:hypothetical protein
MRISGAVGLPAARRRHGDSQVYGVPYMSATADEHFELTLRGFSPRELEANAVRECRRHFGECAWRIEEQTCIPCMGSLGGHIRLYETRIVATTDGD